MEKAEYLVQRRAEELPGVVGVEGEYVVYGAPVSYLQSSLFEDDQALRWVEGEGLMDICRRVSPAKAELMYLAMRKLGYDEAYFLN